LGAAKKARPKGISLRAGVERRLQRVEREIETGDAPAD
jgi:hypothetical protein